MVPASPALGGAARLDALSVPLIMAVVAYFAARQRPVFRQSGQDAAFPVEISKFMNGATRSLIVGDDCAVVGLPTKSEVPATA
jgi:hypothetical protein